MWKAFEWNNHKGLTIAPKKSSTWNVKSLAQGQNMPSPTRKSCAWMMFWHKIIKVVAAGDLRVGWSTQAMSFISPAPRKTPLRRRRGTHFASRHLIYLPFPEFDWPLQVFSHATALLIKICVPKSAKQCVKIFFWTWQFLDMGQR